MSALSGLPIEEALLRYTNLYVRFDLGRDFQAGHPLWQQYLAGVRGAADLRAWTYTFYRDEARGDGSPPVVARFGCFAYARGADGRIRLHFQNADGGEDSPLSQARRPARMTDLAAMLMHVRRVEPAALRVAGTSWLYNIDAYRRLFPPAYLASARVAPDRFQRMALWGQFLDRDGEVRAGAARALRERLARLRAVEALGTCFPFQALAVEAPLRAFYEFHGL